MILVNKGAAVVVVVVGRQSCAVVFVVQSCAVGVTYLLIGFFVHFRPRSKCKQIDEPVPECSSEHQANRLHATMCELFSRHFWRVLLAGIWHI